MAELKDTIDSLGRAFEDFKKANDERLAQIEKKGSPDPLVVEQVEKANKAMSDIQARIDELEADRNRPSNPNAGELPKEKQEYRAAFEDWIRNPKDGEASARLKAAARAGGIHAAVQTTANGDGGYAVPEEISRDIEQKLIDISPIRQIARVVQVGTSDYKELVDSRGMASGWVGETGTRSETGTPTLNEVAPTMGTVYAYPKATEESLQDIFFDVASWLRDSVAEEFAYQEGVAFVSGNGTNKPTGMLAGSTAATGDEDSPARAFGTLEHIPTGVAAAFPNDRLGSPAGNPGDVLLSAIYALKAGYRPMARWMMNKNTLETVRKWKDVDGNYMWAPGLQAGQPSSLLGYSVVEAEAMADIGANALPIAFGDFSGYLIVDRAGVSITVDPYTTPGYVKFYTRKRVGGKLKNDDKIKVIKVATS